MSLRRGHFAVAVGFSLRDGVTCVGSGIGLRCLTDNTLGVYADWKISCGPSGHLLSQV
jgi:hypothetical protein